MDRDIKKILVACVVSLVLAAILIGIRLQGPPAEHSRSDRSAAADRPASPAPTVSCTAAVARSSVPHRDRVDATMTPYALQQWSSAFAGVETSDDEDEDPEELAAEAEDDAPPATRFKRSKKWKKKKRKASAREIARKMQDPEDEVDDGNDGPEEADEDSGAGRLDSPEEIRKAMAAEDRESQADEESEDQLLAGMPEGK